MITGDVLNVSGYALGAAGSPARGTVRQLIGAAFPAGGSIRQLIGVADPVAGFLGSWAAELSTWSVLLRIVLSLLFSAITGWERSVKRHSAGLRTFMLVSLAGTLAAILDSYIYEMTGSGGFTLSAASVIGTTLISIHSVYYSSRNQIKGLTTAAGLWVEGFIGIAFGIGGYTIACISFALLMCALSWFPAIEAYLKNRSNHFEIHLELTNSASLQNFVTTIRRLGLSIDEIEQNPAYVGSGLSVYSIAISISSSELKKYRTHTEIIEALKSLDYIYHIEEMHG